MIYSNPSYLSYPYQGFSSYHPSQTQQLQQERARVLAEQRARRAQWLPEETGDSDDEWDYNQLAAQERAYIDGMRRQAVVDRMRREEAAAAAAARQREEAVRQRLLEKQRWQQELERKQLEDQQRRQALLDERRRQIRQKREEETARSAAEFEQILRGNCMNNSRPSSSGTAPRAPSQPQCHAPANGRQTQTPRQPTPTRPATSQTKPPTPTPKATYTERHENAASRIQQQYRIHHSYRVLADIASQFETLKKDFIYPSIIDFQKPGKEEGHISVRTTRLSSDFDEAHKEDAEVSMDVDNLEGKLAFTAVNYPLHTHMDAMDKLLMKLDGIDSCGKKDIRNKRKSIVLDIAKESAKLERYWKQVWLDHIEQEKEKSIQQQSPSISAPAESEPLDEAKEELLQLLPSLAESHITGEEMVMDPPAQNTLPLATSSEPETVQEEPMVMMVSKETTPTALSSPSLSLVPELVEELEVEAALGEPVEDPVANSDEVEEGSQKTVAGSEDDASGDLSADEWAMI